MKKEVKLTKFELEFKKWEQGRQWVTREKILVRIRESAPYSILLKKLEKNQMKIIATLL